MNPYYYENKLRYLVLQRPEHNIYAPTNYLYYKTKGTYYMIT